MVPTVDGLVLTFRPGPENSASQTRGQVYILFKDMISIFKIL